MTSSHLWRRNPVSHLALAAALLSAPVAHAQFASPSSGAQLWAAGPKRMGPVPYALIEAEALNEQERAALRSAARDRASDDVRRVKELRDRAAPANITEAEKTQAASNLIESLRAAQQKAVLDRRDADDLKVTGKTGIALLSVAAKTPMGAATMVLAGPAIEDSLNKGIDKLTDIEPTYKASVATAVELALLRAKPETVELWQKTGITDANRKDAAKALFGSSNAFFEEGIGKELDPSLKTEIQDIQTSLLKDGLDTIAARQAQGKEAFAAFQQQTETRFSDQKSQIEKVVGQVQTIRRAVAQQTQAIQLFAKTTVMQLERLESKIDGKLDALEASQRATQSAMYRNMGPKDRLTALLDPSFLAAKTDEQRQKRSEEIADLTRLNRILDAKGNIDTALDGIGAAASFAVAVGVKVDVAGITRGVAMAKSAINVGASLATGNYLGALMAAGGLFGGGGGDDPNTAAFAQINARLDQIIDLQKETLAKIDDLSRKIDEQHFAVMSSLQGIEQKINHTNDLLARISAEPYANCRLFAALTDIHDIEVRAGVYATYAERVRHFAIDQRMEEGKSATKCFDFLLRKITLGDVAGAGVFKPAALLESDTWEPAEIGKPQSTAERFKAMWIAHHAMLGWATVQAKRDVAGSKPICMNRAFSKLSGLPAEVDALKETDVSCPSEDISRSDSWHPFKIRDGEASAGTIATSIYSPVEVSHIGEMMLYLTPFFELAVLSKEKDKLRLPEPWEFLKNDAIYTDPTRVENAQRAHHMLEKYPEQLSIALIQQAVREGTYLVPTIARTLKETEFGAKSPGISQKSVRHELAMLGGVDVATMDDQNANCVVSTKAWQERPFLVAACLMEANPRLAKNVARFLAAQDRIALRNQDATLAWAYRTPSEIQLKEVFPSVTTLARVGAPADQTWQWSITINGVGQKVMPFPSVAEVTSRFLDRGATETMRAIRERFELRVQANKADEQLSKPSDKLSDREREVARYYLRQGARREERLIATSLGSWSAEMWRPKEEKLATAKTK